MPRSSAVVQAPKKPPVALSKVGTKPKINPSHHTMPKGGTMGSGL